MSNHPYDDLSDADKARWEALNEQYYAEGHGVQTGIATRLELDPTFATMKDIRVGLDTSKADMGGLVDLLISKGVFTSLEYMEAIVKSMREERERWEKDISKRLGGKKVTLG